MSGVMVIGLSSRLKRGRSRRLCRAFFVDLRYREWPWRASIAVPTIHRPKALALELPARREEPVATGAEDAIDREQQQRPQQQRRVGDADESVAEAGDDVEEGVGVADRPEGGRQALDR